MTHPFAIFCMVAIAAGLFVCALMIHRYYEFRTAGKWPKAPGRISASRVHFTTTGSSEGSPGDPRYDILIEYEYEVDGTLHRGRRKTLAGRSPLFHYERAAEEELKREYTVGRPVDVYYNPRRPRSCTLGLKVDNRQLLVVFLGGLALASFPLAALGGLFAKRGSLLATASTPLVLLTLGLLAAILYVSFRMPGEWLEGRTDLD